MPAIVIVTGRVRPDGTCSQLYESPFYHGLFKDGDSACEWAAKNCPGLAWHWDEVALQVNDDGSPRIE